MRTTIALVLTALLSSLAAGAQPPAAAPAPLAVKVLVINLFGLEAAPWIAALKPTQDIAVSGLSSDYPFVKCNAAAVCQMTTGMGHANAAASVMAVMLSSRFDLRRTYFLIAGIAGIDPAHGTLGSVAWARYLVDVGIAHEIDARELPKGWSEGYFGVMTNGPDEVPRFDYRTEMFQLDEPLLRQALALSHGVQLEDAQDLRAYRRHYAELPAKQPPAVIQCDTLSGDTWWSGRRLSEHARHWTQLLTDGKGVYCTTQQEDNAVLNVLTRGAASGLLDRRRVADLRSGADFDRPYPGQSAVATLFDQRRLSDSASVAANNLVHAGMPLVNAIVAHWDEWQRGVPPTAP